MAGPARFTGCGWPNQVVVFLYFIPIGIFRRHAKTYDKLQIINGGRDRTVANIWYFLSESLMSDFADQKLR